MTRENWVGKLCLVYGQWGFVLGWTISLARDGRCINSELLSVLKEDWVGFYYRSELKKIADPEEWTE